MDAITIAALDDNKTHLQMVEQALFGVESNWDSTVDFKGFQSGVELLAELKRKTYDCVILDRIVPDMDGDVILQWIAQYAKGQTGVVMLTSRDRGQEVVESLTMGADEYLTKPFYPEELLLRVKRVIERVQDKKQQESRTKVLTSGEGADAAAAGIHNFHGTIFNDFTLTIDHHYQIIKLTDREYHLAKLLFNNIGVNLSRKLILERIWFGESAQAGRSLTTLIHKIRDKLELTIENGWVLRPVYGYGYRLDKV